MIQILENTFNDKKAVKISIKKIYGINNFQASIICKKLGFSDNLKIKKLDRDQIEQLKKELKNLNFLINKDLKKNVALRKNFLINIKTYRGLRLANKLPAKGQRTHTNAKSIKKLNF